ncbi:MAG: twin-arginine translocase subunit TatC [Actinomycetota bacterium]|nr:twin-arginine translocase subunit TatC [Actinomycetota bacterium]
MIDHLEELRTRLIVCVIGFVLGTAIAYIFYQPILDFLLHPVLSKRVPAVYVSGVVTAFVVRLKVSVFAGFIIALPVTLFEMWRFITPGLEPREKRYAVPFVLSSLALFALGTFFAFLILPTGIKFLLSFASGPLKPLIFIDQYLSFLMFMILAFGISFEFPLVLIFLAGVGIISSRQLRAKRRHAIFLAFVVGAVATPSQDPYSMTAMAVPLYILYEVSILVVRFALKK